VLWDVVLQETKEMHALGALNSSTKLSTFSRRKNDTPHIVNTTLRWGAN